jgi:signal transduction histidine kinase
MVRIAAHTATSTRGGRTPAGPLRERVLVGVALGGAALCAGAVGFALASAPPGQRAIAATAQALGVGLPLAVGLIQWARRREDRFARMLVGAAALWSLTALATSSDPALYSAGRVAAWVVQPVLVLLLLAFPAGRLDTRLDRGLVAANVAIFGLLFLPSALLASDYPAPAPWSTCGVDCPHNALALAHDHAGTIPDVIRPLRQALAFAVLLGVIVVLVQRTRAAGALMRRVLTPVVVVAVVHAAVSGAYVVARSSDPLAPGVATLGWVYVMTLPALTLCFAAGLLGWRLFVASALEHLALGLPRHASAPELRCALAVALEDPGLHIVYRLRGAWIDEAGWPTEAPRAGPDRDVTEVTAAAGGVASIVHRRELSQDPALVRAAGAYALVALENERLVHDLELARRRLSDSRARLATVADHERRRLERDLHDGAQQRLVALQIKLALLREQLERDASARAEAARDLEVDVERASEEVRSLAHGIHPPMLAERGIRDALRAAARSAPLPTIVRATRLPRYPPEVESAVYFACMEALQNATKHAIGATGVTISVAGSDDGRVRFEVRDDGAGFRPSEHDGGTGLANLRERLAALGGELAIASAPGDGTRVVGTIPLR